MTEILYTLTSAELYAHLVSCLGQEVMDTLFGILLGDARLNFTSFAKASAYIEQSQIHASYLVALYGALIHLAVKAPKLRYHGKFRKDGSEIVSAGFSLASSSELGILAYLFYIPRESRDSTYVRNVPFMLLPFALTARALAFWIADDGSFFRTGGVYLNTQSFSLGDVMSLLWTLEMHHGLVCTLHTKRIKSGKVGYCIYITRGSLPRLQAIVGPYIPTSLRYKVHL